jgi:hypothetical protein
MKAHPLITDNLKVGKIALIYGETGVGKTVTTLQTLKGTILLITLEHRDSKVTLGAIADSGRNPTEISEAAYTNWDDLMEFLGDVTKFKGIDNIVVDGLTELCSTDLQFEIAMQAFEARDSGSAKELTNQSKMSQESYGTLGFQLNRMMGLIGNYAKDGKNIVITSLLSEYPKWNRILSAAPALAGRSFPTALPGKCDFIGLVERRYSEIADDKGNVVIGDNGEPLKKLSFPPRVKFEPKHGEQFLCKWTGARDNAKEYMIFPLDWDRIFGISDRAMEVLKDKYLDKKVQGNVEGKVDSKVVAKKEV